ncbi:MAG: formate dehydrogenase accessory sulfurtransferase FdhD [Candidatus Latescibacteria bacterium]|jgi:FdhD protein|nr:formate dehydrogenase accessory sulfurtransferase FdhD [Candidatus Latescibacterota bacterium]
MIDDMKIPTPGRTVESSDRTDRRTARIGVHAVDGSDVFLKKDVVAIEEPLEIRVGYGSTYARRHRSVSVTMRTPGHDQDLVMGFLFTEGIIGAAGEVTQVEIGGGGGSQPNIATVELKPEVELDDARVQRSFIAASSCGICGKTTLAGVKPPEDEPLARATSLVEPATIKKMPIALAESQPLFGATGGVHAAGLFSAEGEIIIAAEDIGRHNAVDKIVGSQLSLEAIPLSYRVLMVSGRTSFEIIHKARAAGVPVVASVGAPSSLAVELADEWGMTLIGFVTGDRFNIYSSAERVEVR